MRIAVFSDVHANLNGLNAVLEDIARRGGADIVVAAGDLVTDGPRPVETFERLLHTNCLLIRGNHDEYLLGRGKEMIKPDKRENMWQQTMWATRQFPPEYLALLDRQPLQRIFSPGPGIVGHDLLVVHANLNDVYGYTGHLHQEEAALAELYGAAPPGVEIIAFGHWHAHSVRNWRGMRLVNIASIAFPCDRAKLAAYTLFNWDNRLERWRIEQHRVPFDWEEEARLIEECGLPGYLWQLEEFYYETANDRVAV